MLGLVKDKPKVDMTGVVYPVGKEEVTTARRLGWHQGSSKVWVHPSTLTEGDKERILRAQDKRRRKGMVVR